MTDYKTIKELSVLSQGRNPDFYDAEKVLSGSLPGPPSSASDGAGLKDAVLALIVIARRLDPSKRQADITVDTVDDTATYTVTIDGTAHDYAASAGDGELEIITGLKDAINAGSKPVVATLEDADDDGTDDTLHVEGDPSKTGGSDDYTISVSATGSGALSLEADATTYSAKLHFMAEDIEVWAVPDNATKTDHQENWIARPEVGGLSRADIEITATDGRLYTYVGPCVLEEE